MPTPTKGPRLGGGPAHERLMLANLAAALFTHKSIKTTESGGSRGFDAGKKVKGRKRHVAVDSNGWLLAVLVTAASVQDRDAGHRLVALLRERFSTITLVWADGGYAGRLVAWATSVLGRWTTGMPRW